MPHQPTLLFVHGTNTSAYSWSGLVNELNLRGHRAVAVDLPGHGDDAHFPAAYQAPQDLAALATEPTPLAELTAEDYRAHVVAAVKRAAVLGPVILIGSSQGGVTVSLVGNQVPDLLDRVVYVGAYCCVELPSLNAYLETPENAESLLPAVTAAMVGDPATLGVARINWRTADPEHIEGIRQCLAGDLPYEKATWLLNLLQPDEPVGIPMADARGHAETWGRIPRTYVRLTEDRLIPPALQDRFIAEADRLTPDNPTEVRDIAAPHVGPFGRTEFVELFAELATR